MAYLIIMGLIWLVVIWAVGIAAEKRGRGIGRWMLLAFFIGIFAFIPLLIAGSTRQQRALEITEDEELRNTVRQSPVADRIRELGELYASGHLTDTEFETKKAELLARL